MNNSDRHKYLQHFILTRFNLLLWNKDKSGAKVRSVNWLDHRFSLFEKYCLPSVKKQTCQDFVWIVLFDNSTPDNYKKRIVNYQEECPQFTPILVESAKGRFFADIFRREMQKRLGADKIVSTYLDNDDALNIGFVEDLQRRALCLNEGTFINYNDGYQYYLEGSYLMRIHYPTNHFVSVIERGDPRTIKGIFGYGSHAYIGEIKGVKIEHVKNQLMWCEVIHEKNMVNDAYFLNAKMERDGSVLSRNFGVEEVVKSSFWIYTLKFLPRYAKTFVRRAKERLLGRVW